MKIKCDVCKTEYSVSNMSAGQVRCAVCGNVWRVSKPKDKRSLLVFVASLCALLAATVFAVAVIVTTRRADPAKMPLVAQVSNYSTVVDEGGANHLVVNGTVTNRSGDIYGLPDLIIISYDAKGEPIARQRFMPSATLLDAGQTVSFSHTLSGDVSGVKKVTVELAEFKTGTKK
ncbi:MAG: FxLYD domain-containing protein [Alphaproteobacteria bacterium]|nr:FxLYD domain-containing protein [Alphaproteobacteria bacterium]